MVSARSAGALFPAFLYEGSHVLERRPLGSGPSGQSVYPPGDRSGGPYRGRRPGALPPGALALGARPPRVRALCHDPNLGRGGGKKRPRRAWPQSSWTGPWRIFRGMWRPMSSMTAPAACSRRSIIAATSASSLPCGITIPPTTTSGRFSGGSKRPWWHAACPAAGSPPLARRSLLHPSGRGSGRCGIKSASVLASPRWRKRWGGRWPAPVRAWQPHHPHCAKGAQARQWPRRRPAPKGGWQRTVPRCAPRALAASNGT
jgi:hypothetical protein